MTKRPRTPAAMAFAALLNWAAYYFTGEPFPALLAVVCFVAAVVFYLGGEH